MQKTIKMRDVLRDMTRLDVLKNPIPFNVSVREFSVQNESGGRLVEYKNATLLQQQKSNSRSLKALASGKDEKEPNHWENKTRNIKVNGKIRKLNILFIVEYNGIKVVY